MYGWTPSVDDLNELLQLINGGSYFINPCSLQQLRIISIHVMAEMESVDQSYQLFRIGGEFLGTQNIALSYTAVYSVDLRLLIIMVVRRCSTKSGRNWTGSKSDRWHRNDESTRVIAYHDPLYQKPNKDQGAPGQTLHRSRLLARWSHVLPWWRSSSSDWLYKQTVDLAIGACVIPCVIRCAHWISRPQLAQQSSTWSLDSLLVEMSWGLPVFWTERRFFQSRSNYGMFEYVRENTFLEYGVDHLGM